MLKAACICVLNLAAIASFAADKGSLIAVNQNDDNLSLIDLATGTQVAKLTEEGHIKAHEVAVSPDGKTLYVPIYGSAGVGHKGTDGSEMLVMDVASRKVIHVVDFGHGIRPHKPVYDIARHLLYVTGELDQAVMAIDPKTYKTLYTIPTGQSESHMLVISHDGRFGYTANVGPGSVSVLDLKTHITAAIIPVAKHIQRIAISKDDKTVYVSDTESPRLAVIDTASRAIKTWVDLPAKGYGSAVTLDGRLLVLTLPSSKQIALVDLSTLQVTKTIDVPGHPQEVLLSHDGATAWVSCSISKQVAAIDTKTWQVKALLPAGMWVDGLAWTPFH